MGMDVYGKNPTTEEGQYFRRNVWGWHPLWQYCEELHSDICNKVKNGHDNSGDGLGPVNSKKLSKRLSDDIISGRTAEYMQKRNDYLLSLSKEECRVCKGTKIASHSPLISAMIGIENASGAATMDPFTSAIITNSTCNVCDDQGLVESFDKHYYLELQDIIDFSVFLNGCGGFSIC